MTAGATPGRGVALFGGTASVTLTDEQALALVVCLVLLMLAAARPKDPSR